MADTKPVRLPIRSPNESGWDAGLTIGALLRAMFPTGTQYLLTIDETAESISRRRGGTRNVDAIPRLSADTPPLRLVPVSLEEAASVADEAVKLDTRLEEEIEWLRLIKDRELRRKLLPRVSQLAKVGAQSRQKLLYRQAPLLPADLFLAMGLLLDLSGASHHVVAIMGEEKDVPVKRYRPLTFTSEQRREAGDAADAWRKGWMTRERNKAEFDFLIPHAVQQRWTNLWTSYWKEKVFVRLPVEPIAWKRSRTFKWWSDALFLFVTADEALRNVGFPGVERTRANHSKRGASGYPRLEKYYDLQLTLGRAGKKRSKAAINAKVGHDALFSISTVPQDIACVLPKSRTAQVGCTLRSLSHNAALLPSQGRARAQWWMFPAGDKPNAYFPQRSDREPLNLLLIPYPFDVPNDAISATHLSSDEGLQAYGWFKIRSAWMDNYHIMDKTRRLRRPPAEVIFRLTEDLTKQAAKAVGPIHGIVFPELALSFDDFSRLVNEITASTKSGDTFESVDLLVAGLRSDDTERKGNFAGACVFSKPTAIPGRKERIRQILWNVQEKHHRWRVDKRQIKSYGIGPQLSSGLLWWEDIELLSRSLNVFVFRDCSTVAPLICEDLARIEPVHELVRAIGPNLIIALLMDGPQLPDRWPGRYALGLAEDPGSSVLTLSSFGLIRRAHAVETDPNRKSFSVGLWRNDNGDTTQLALEPGKSAIVLSLAGEAVEESTLDGRPDDGVAMRWAYVAHKLIAADSNKFPWARA